MLFESYSDTSGAGRSTAEGTPGVGMKGRV